MLQNSIAVIKHYDYNLSALADSISLTNEEIISYRKSRPRYPPYHANECMICHKQLGHRGVKKCTSHSLPQFVLKHLGTKIYNINAFIKVPFEKEHSGIGEAGIFKLICEHCDNTFFQDYEDESKYTAAQSSIHSSQKALNEVALKNYLHSLYGNLSDRKRYRALIEDIKKAKPRAEETIENLKYEVDVLTADIKDIKASLETTLSSRPLLDSKPSYRFYEVVYYHVFQRSFPIAAQGKVTIDTDCWGNKINNLYDYDIPPQDLHICFFPSDSETAVLVFTEKANDRFDKMRDTIHSLTDDSIAKAFLSMFIAQNANFFLSSSIERDLFDNQYLRQLSGEDGIVQSYSHSTMPISRDQILKSIQDNQISGSLPLLLQYEKIPNCLIGK